jgi:hypothetical protein
MRSRILGPGSDTDLTIQMIEAPASRVTTVNIAWTANRASSKKHFHALSV